MLICMTSPWESNLFFSVRYAMKKLKSLFAIKPVKLTRKTVLKLIGDVLILVAGNAAYALAVAMLVLPSGVAIGGITGLCVMLHRFIPIDIAYMVFVINFGLFVLGAVVIGRHFAVTTAASTVLYPFFLHIFENIFSQRPSVVDGDLPLSAVMAGIVIGGSIGFLARAGASTGGMDIPPLVINKLTGLPVGSTMLCFDAAVIGSQLFFSSIRQTLYGILMVIVYSYVINQVMVMGNGKVQIEIISDKTEAVRAAILTEVNRGVTLLEAQRGLSGEKCQMLITVVYNRQLAKAKKVITAADPDAFVWVSSVSEVRGNGFSFSKGDRKLDKSDI